MCVEQVELNALNTVCGISIARGELDRAIQAGEQCLALSKDRGEFWVRGYVLNFLAQAHWLRGERSYAEALARESVVCKHAVDDRNGLTIALETLAWMAAERGQHQRTGCLLGAAERVRDESALTLIELFRVQHDRSVAVAVQGAGQRSFDAAFARGRALTIDEGVAFAMEGKRPPKPAPAARGEPQSELTHRPAGDRAAGRGRPQQPADRGPAVFVGTDGGDPYHQHPEPAGPGFQDPAQPLDSRYDRIRGNRSWRKALARPNPAIPAFTCSRTGFPRCRRRAPRRRPLHTVRKPGSGPVDWPQCLGSR